MDRNFSESCVKLIHLLFSLIEERGEPYLKARKCLAKSSHISLLLQLQQLKNQGVDCCNEKLRKMYSQVLDIIECLKNKLTECEKSCEEIEKEEERRKCKGECNKKEKVKEFFEDCFSSLRLENKRCCLLEIASF